MDNVLKIYTKFEKEKNIHLVFESEEDYFFVYFNGKVLDSCCKNLKICECDNIIQHPFHVQVRSSVFEQFTCWYIRRSQYVNGILITKYRSWGGGKTSWGGGKTKLKD